MKVSFTEDDRLIYSLSSRGEFQAEMTKKEIAEFKAIEAKFWKWQRKIREMEEKAIAPPNPTMPPTDPICRVENS